MIKIHLEKHVQKKKDSNCSLKYFLKGVLWFYVFLGVIKMIQNEILKF